MSAAEGASEASSPEQANGESERTSEWPSTYISILVYSRAQCDVMTTVNENETEKKTTGEGGW